ncbi:MAG: uracil-DNA glycosylase family protein [Candidatus Cyclobacteriaceae bacterium M2_1C_046]
MVLGEKIIGYYKNLKAPKLKAKDVDILFPYNEQPVIEVIEKFYSKYFMDNNPRKMLIGINPGRFGGGITGIPFTDPINLEEKCSIPNAFSKRFELSSRFMYDMIEEMGGPEVFYSLFYFYSVSPVGFTKNGKNYNYYDDKALKEELEPYVVEHMHKQFEMGMDNKLAFSLGQGKNVKELMELNAKYKFFKEIVPLPHPRWVMQYRLKKKEFYIDAYMKALLNKI